MSEETSAALVEAALEGAVDKIKDKFAETTFLNAISFFRETFVSTLATASKDFLTPLEKVSLQRIAWDTAQRLSDQASKLADGAKKTALLLEATVARTAAKDAEQAFISQFAPGGTFAQAIAHAIDVPVEQAAKYLLGPLVGGFSMQHALSAKLDEALAEGKSAEDAARLVAQQWGFTSTQTLGSLVEGISSFVETGRIAGTAIDVVGPGARAAWVIGRASLAGAALGVTWEFFYQGGTWLYQQPWFNERLADGIDGIVASMSGSNNVSRFPSDVGALTLLTTRIDGELAADALNAILQASAPTYRDRNELNALLGKLRKLFIPGAGDVDAKDSNEYLSAMAATLAAVKRTYPVGQLKIEPLTDAAKVQSAAAQAAGDGADALAYRYALRQLNPFVVKGIDYTQSAYNGNAELNLYDPQTDKGNLTEEWFDARVDMLTAFVNYNTKDGALSAGIDKKYVDKITNTELGQSLFPTDMVVFGGDRGDSLSGGISDDKIFAGGGSDTISGGAGNDYIEGNDGDDAIDAGMDDDEVYGGEGKDTIDGYTGDDQLFGGKGDDTINGGLGDDTIYGDMKDDPDSTDIAGDDTIDGGWGKDEIYGGGGKDTIHGGRDDDTIEGNDNDDTLYGDEGGDNIDGGKGRDTITGGAGYDTIDGGDDNDVIYGGDGEADGERFGNELKGDAGDDKLYGDGGKDTIDGGDDNDLLVGNFGADILRGGDGNDEIYGDLKDENSLSGDDDQLEGGDGADKLYGGNGRDVLLGGDGNDELHGGKGIGDYMVGGAGHDYYVYLNDDGADLIYDEDDDGEISYDGHTLGHGINKGESQLEWYEGDPCDAEFTYTATGNPNEGPVTLTIKSKHGGQLTVFNFQNGDLDIGLQDGNDVACTKKPPKPPGGPGNQQRGDPLLLDLGSVGITTYGLGQNLHFDLDSDGFAELVGWSGAEDGMLVFDANGDGRLNDGQELFGDFTRLAGGQLATSGFQALSQHDRNHDGVIDALDPVWSSLRVGVWERDPFGHLILGDPTTAMSLKSLDALGISSISLASTIVTNSGTSSDTTVNIATRMGSYSLADGSTRDVAEYRLARDNSDTKFTQYLPQPEANASDPSVVVGGQVMNLNQALVRDGDGGYLGQPEGALRAKLDAFLGETQVTNYFARFEDLLFAWTGADYSAAVNANRSPVREGWRALKP